LNVKLLVHHVTGRRKKAKQAFKQNGNRVISEEASAKFGIEALKQEAHMYSHDTVSSHNQQ
jgi:hypothetical protein